MLLLLTPHHPKEVDSGPGHTFAVQGCPAGLETCSCPWLCGWGTCFSWVMLRGPQAYEGVVWEPQLQPPGQPSALGSASLHRARPEKCKRKSKTKLTSKAPQYVGFGVQSDFICQLSPTASVNNFVQPQICHQGFWELSKIKCVEPSAP